MIANIEKRIFERQQLIRFSARSCVQELRKNIVSPPMLLAAAGVGFLIGKVTKRRPISPDKSTNKISGIQKLSADLLKLTALIRTLSPVSQLLPAWLFPQASSSNNFAKPESSSARQTQDIP
jgi:hypothetical protein